MGLIPKPPSLPCSFQKLYLNFVALCGSLISCWKCSLSRILKNIGIDFQLKKSIDEHMSFSISLFIIFKINSIYEDRPADLSFSHTFIYEGWSYSLPPVHTQAQGQLVSLLIKS